MSTDHTCPRVSNLLLLDSEGKRIAVKYFDENKSSVTAQGNYEKSVFAKTSRTNARGEAEITMFDDVIVVYKFYGDLMFFVTGSQEENELIIFAVLQAFYESISLLLRGAVEKKTVLENLDLILLAMDETVDGGMILETDPATIASRVSMRGADSDVPLAQQTLSQAFASAREQLTNSLLNNGFLEPSTPGLEEEPKRARIATVPPPDSAADLDMLGSDGPRSWPRKADLYIMRTDGNSCSRETVKASSGCFSFAYPSTQQQMLVWKARPKRAMVLKKLGPELREEFLAVIDYLGRHEGMQIVVEPAELEVARSHPAASEFVDTFAPGEEEGLHKAIDFVVCLGGDGVLLHASSLYKRAIPPVISFNLGSLGFLTNHTFDDFQRDLRDVITGCEDLAECSLPGEVMRGVHITLRMRLMCEVWRAGAADSEQTYEVMNEVVVDRGANPYLTKIECWEHGRLITKVQADGVMLATPTGSTAYSVAAGGSMVHPNVPAILFTPICPHSLSFRPVILPDYAEVELRIPEDARCSAWVCFDGKQRQELQHGDSVRVRMSPNPVPTVDRQDQTIDWFGSLNRCFGWNDRGAEQRAFGSPRWNNQIEE